MIVYIVDRKTKVVIATERREDSSDLNVAEAGKGLAKITLVDKYISKQIS